MHAAAGGAADAAGGGVGTGGGREFNAQPRSLPCTQAHIQPRPSHRASYQPITIRCHSQPCTTHPVTHPDTHPATPQAQRASHQPITIRCHSQPCTALVLCSLCSGYPSGLMSLELLLPPQSGLFCMCVCVRAPLPSSLYLDSALPAGTSPKIDWKFVALRPSALRSALSSRCLVGWSRASSPYTTHSS